MEDGRKKENKIPDKNKKIEDKKTSSNKSKRKSTGHLIFGRTQ